MNIIRTFTVEPTADQMNYLQSLQYDVDNLVFLISKLSLQKVSEKDLDYWKQAYLDKSKELSLIKSEINKEYISPNITKDEVASWNANFSKGILEVSVYEKTK